MVKKIKKKKKQGKPAQEPKLTAKPLKVPTPPSEEEIIGDITDKQKDLVTELFWLFADTLSNETQTPEEEKLLTNLLERKFWVIHKAIYKRVFLFADYFSFLKYHIDVNRVRSGCPKST